MPNRRVVASLEELENHLQLIEYFSKSINKSNSIDDILWDICSNCTAVLGFVDCVVYLLDDSSQELVQRAAFGNKAVNNSSVKDPIRIPLGKGIVGAVALSGEPEIVADTSIDSRYIVDDQQRLSELAVPIIFKDKVIGVIDSEHPQPDFFNPNHARTLSNIATICAQKIAWYESNQAVEIAANFQMVNPNPAMRIHVLGEVLDYNSASKEILKAMKWDGHKIGDLLCLKVIRDVVHYGNRVFFVDGENKSWKVHCVAIENKPSVYLFATDVSELILAKKEAEEARIEKAKFLSAMSHEIRTPLHAIISLTDLLGTTDLTKKQDEYLDMLRFSGKNLLALVNDILEFERLELATIEIEQNGFQLDATIRMLLDSFKVLAEEKGIFLQCNLQPISNFYIRSDQQKITQILTNLLGNAIKFTDQGGVRLDVDIEPNVDGSVTVEFAVIDTGVGIPPNQISEIFEVFKMGHSDSRKRGGTGLGLAITKRLSDFLGGSVSVKSEVGKGSQFTFRLKVDIVLPDSEKEATVVSQNLLLNKRVLVVDDNRVNILVASTFLRQWGAIPTEVDSGIEALVLLEKEEFDAVLMDIQMPKMDGIETTKRYFSNPKQRFVPIIGLTADVFPETRNAAMAAGMIELITKPFNPRALEAILSSLVSD